jgi:hypothetical protein
MLIREGNPFEVVSHIDLDENKFEWGSFGGVLNIDDVIADFERTMNDAKVLGLRLLPLSALLRILADLDLAKRKLPRLNRVVLAAADLGEQEIAEYWPRVQPMPKQGWTFYVSRNDLAMWASGAIHRQPRIGDSRQRVFTVPSADTVEATNVAPLRKALGHSYVIDNVSVSHDVRAWVMDKKSPEQRGLKRLSNRPIDYWSILEK